MSRWENINFVRDQGGDSSNNLKLFSSNLVIQHCSGKKQEKWSGFNSNINDELTEISDLNNRVNNIPPISLSDDGEWVAMAAPTYWHEALKEKF